MKKYLTKIRNQLLVDFWEDNKADYKIKEIGEIFGIGDSQVSRILDVHEKSKDPLRFIRKHIKRSHKKVLKQMRENEKNT